MQNFDISNTTLKNFNTEQILTTINEFGFARIDDFIEVEKLEILHLGFEQGLAYNNYKYGYGSMARFETMENELAVIKEFFNRPFFQSIRTEVLVELF